MISNNHLHINPKRLGKQGIWLEYKTWYETGYFGKMVAGAKPTHKIEVYKTSVGIIVTRNFEEICYRYVRI